jgi:hypothetical protein
VVPLLTRLKGSYCEAFEDGVSARLFTYSDIEEAAQIAAELHADRRQLEALGARAREVAQRFDADETVAAYAALLREQLRVGKPTRREASWRRPSAWTSEWFGLNLPDFLLRPVRTARVQLRQRL